MALALFWETVKPPEKVGGVGDPFDVIKTLIETFGRNPNHPLAPVDLERGHIFTLRQLGGHGSIFHELANLVELRGKLRVWGQG